MLDKTLHYIYVGAKYDKCHLRAISKLVNQALQNADKPRTAWRRYGYSSKTRMSFSCHSFKQIADYFFDSLERKSG